MNVLLKIVEGPNKGAEIALVEGVDVTLGKRDDCDVVLADSTLPDNSILISVQGGEVSVDGAPLRQFQVKTLGATSFAVGPADSPWGELSWPKPESGEQGAESGEQEEEKSPASEPSGHQPDKPSDHQPDEPSAPQTEKPSNHRHRRRGCLGCLVALFLILLVLAGLGWLYWGDVKDTEYGKRLSPFVSRAKTYVTQLPVFNRNRQTVKPSNHQTTKTPTLADVASKYGLSLVETNGVARLSGNLKTRRERLEASAEAYQLVPGAEVDLSDDESFRTSAEDALFTLTEGALKLASATNRVLAISGTVASPEELKKTVEALSADLPKMRDVDLRQVRFNVNTGFKMPEAWRGTEEKKPDAPPGVRRVAARKPAAAPVFPVCGILTTPYPYLVMRDGRRIMEGAAFADGVILSIQSDSVTYTNSIGRFTWKP